MRTPTRCCGILFPKNNLLNGLSNKNKMILKHLRVACSVQEFLKVDKVSYRPTGASKFLINQAELCLPDKSLGLIYGRSGSGKTTLLQLMAGLATVTSGNIFLGDEEKEEDRIACSRSELATQAGIVFQFPERYFLTQTVVDELTFGWPRRREDVPIRQALLFKLQAALLAVGLSDVSLHLDPRDLSGGNQRRLALATQLVRMPRLLLLDEPLAGLDWKARSDVVKLLEKIKKVCTVVVVSHDLKELLPLVDKAWRMEMGGVLKEVPWPPPDFEDQDELFEERARALKIRATLDSS